MQMPAHLLQHMHNQTLPVSALAYALSLYVEMHYRGWLPEVRPTRTTQDKSAFLGSREFRALGLFLSSARLISMVKNKQATLLALSATIL